MNLNVLKDFPYSTRYYITHPWKWFKDCWINLKNAWYRAIKGYCYTDLWNINDWLLEVLPNMLQELADKHCAYPGQPPFKTPEDWEDWLRKIADQLIKLREDEEEHENQYARVYYAALAERRAANCNNTSLAVTNTLNDEELLRLRDKYFIRRDEIIAEKQALAIETGKELFEYLNYLWD